MNEALTCQFDFDPDELGKQTDALFHLGESYPFAHGKLDGIEWECRLSNCGEQRLYDKKGNRISNDDLVNMYDSDEKLLEAIDKDEITIGNNSWWELEFFRVDDDSHWYLDLFPDNSEMADNPAHALAYFIKLSKDKNFVKHLKLALVGEDGKTDM